MRARKGAIAAVSAGLAAVGTLLAAPAGATSSVQAPAATQPAEIPSVDVSPVGTTATDPNAGQWFVFSLQGGASAGGDVRITNPAEVAQTVQLYVRDLEILADGTPQVLDGEQEDVGAWTRMAQPTLTVPARSAVVVPFSVQVPTDAEPGDHVGVIVAEAAAKGTQVKMIKRVATRLYVTVPGAAVKSFRIEGVEHTIDSTWWPRSAALSVTLRNTGRVRLHPQVQVDGTAAQGAAVMLAHSVEPYTATTAVPWWGGRRTFTVDADSEGGLSEQRKISTFIVPWGLLVVLLLVVVVSTGLVALVRRWRRWRRARALSSVSGSEVEMLLAAFHRAVADGSADSAARLALSLHELDRSPQALAAVTQALGLVPSGSERHRRLAEVINGNGVGTGEGDAARLSSRVPTT
jgi:hypothetical protein